ncbi:HAMP domain-containing sensor histidine kinase [Marinobacter sp. 2_MG-2023]|uniref:sensor histidine kinase n=1 Tax=Marinobacter sp. 2_MG-2023 TaxID=3062679 RepID=UPI0026E1590F|nr:HAMP domain-containing sensor histidine kinase [Marinobacter sp. 2_MG-2023]MDO6443609.1 HAMP domain-containing sensor histidine kinase [Marinobacter sp. 2_MG-2023]
MSGWLVISLQVITGFFILAGIQHIGHSLYEGRDKVHGFLGLTALSAASFALFRFLAHTAETAELLVLFRKGEVVSISLFCVFLLWFIVEYTAYKKRPLLFLLTAGWGLFIMINVIRPYGLIFSELPLLSSLAPASGSNLDLRSSLNVPLNIALRVYVLTTLAYCGYACIRIKSFSQSYRARVALTALSLMAPLCALDLLIGLELTGVTFTSDFSFFPLVAIMSLSLLKETNNERNRMITILNFLPIGLAINDSNNENVFSNNAFKKLQAEVIGSGQVAAMESATQFQAKSPNVTRSQTATQNAQLHTVLRWPINGKTSIFEITRVPILNNRETRDETAIIFNDISERLRKVEEIEKLNKHASISKRLVTSSVSVKSLSHEIRQPLAAILNNAQAGLNFIKNPNYDIKEIEDIFNDIVRDEKRAGEIINGLRATVEEQETQFETLNLSKTLHEVIQVLENDLTLNSIYVHGDGGRELYVQANESQLQQVLINVIENAIDAMFENSPGSRRLKIETSQEENQAVISVADTGKGIPSSQLEQVFEDFYTTKPQGLGVGLEVCRAIMERHNGKIWAKKNNDRGMTFYISMPIYSPSPNTPK